ncbi:MAG: tRNA(Ile)-lysidine synthase [bacterium]|nr:tRNA(Ile)-lysidine synthase [bacterium]
MKRIKRNPYPLNRLNPLTNSVMEFLQQFCQHCATKNLIQTGDRLLLAVSGGLDSCVLLDLFGQVKNEWQWQLAVAHVNHQLRGEASDQDESLVKMLAEQAGLPFYTQRVDVYHFAQTHKLSIETAARELRYQALENFRQEWQGRAIVTAHTRDDQAETILDHLLRGSGLAGLAGMAADAEILYGDLSDKSSHVVVAHLEGESSTNVRPLKGQLRTQRRTKILRPLLPFSKAELEAYARERGLQWREDHTNTDTQFRRNRIRHELLPRLKTRFNPQIDLGLARLAEVAATAEDYFRAEAETRLREIVKEQQTGKIILDLELFWKYFPIIQRYVIRAVLQRLMVNGAEPTFVEMTQILTLLQKTDPAKLAIGKRYIWRQQVDMCIDRDGVVFRKRRTKGKRQKANSKRQTAKGISIPVALGERCEISESGMAILIERKALPPDWRQQVQAHSQFVDAEKIQGDLFVRFPQPGDRFVPLRTNSTKQDAGGTKKLSDFFTDHKIPLHQRTTIPLLWCDQIIWVCGYRLDNRYKITPATHTVLHLQMLPLQIQVDHPVE